ncbi:MAG TPA: VWA domain-containing protein [Pyrinomonadaceae bacterium]|nr:VWA domain-containing protein [Pyrinomonadaceae bacterium]
MKPQDLLPTSTIINARLALLFALLLTCSAVIFGQDDEVIKVDSSLVTLNAAVLDASGKPVSGLKREQFKVFEDEREQSIGFFAAEETPFAAVIVIDTSGSMAERMSLARSAAIRFLEGLRTDDEAKIYRFDSKVELVQDFSNGRDVGDKIYDLKSRGMTALNDAVFQAASDLSKRPEKRRAIIVLSDGEDTYSGHSAEKALKAALAADAVIYTVDMSTMEGAGARRPQNQGVLRTFAEKTGGTFIATPGGTILRDAFKAIVNDLGTQYTLAYQPTSARDGKWHALEIRIDRPNLKIRTRKGYNAEKQ